MQLFQRSVRPRSSDSFRIWIFHTSPNWAESIYQETGVVYLKY